MSFYLKDTPCDCDIRVWFDTGFWFMEGNTHIVEFGGEEEGMIDVGCVKWRSRTEVQVTLDALGISLTAFEDYPHSLQGTKSLYTVLKEQGESMKHIFGILIWHQLGYTVPLMGCWESGQCGSEQCWYRST